MLIDEIKNAAKQGNANAQFELGKYHELSCGYYTDAIKWYLKAAKQEHPDAGESIYWEEQRNLNDTEYRRISTFPSDFDFCNAKVRYVCGMSVPPMMTAKIVEQIKTQWLNSSLNKL